MSKKPNIKDAIAAVAAREPAAAVAPSDDVVASSGDRAGTLRRRDVAGLIPVNPSGKSADATSGKRPHTSFYASEAVLKTIRVLAAEDGVRPQEIFRRAMKAYFATKGKDFDALDKM